MHQMASIKVVESCVQARVHWGWQLPQHMKHRTHISKSLTTLSNQQEARI